MDRSFFDKSVCREGNGNMKGAFAETVPAESVVLWGAEMDYATAPCVRNALAKFAENGIYGFTVPTPAYKKAICEWMQFARNTEIHPDWIVPVMGTVFALSTAVRAFTDEGDGVIIQSPSYYRFDIAVERNERRLILNPLLENHGIYQLDFVDLEEKMADPRNRLLILVNPHNPTGRVFKESELLRIAGLAKQYGVVVFCDEIFAETVQPGHEFRPGAYLSDQLITCFSLGKSFNFTGVSQANLLISDAGLRERYIFQRDRDHFGSIDPFFYNAVLAAYSSEGKAWLDAMNAHTAENYAVLQRAIRKMPRLSVSPLEGTYVAWLDCRRLGFDSEALQHFFEHDAGIIADPGAEYGAAGFYRWNIATTRQNLEVAISQLEGAYQKNFNDMEVQR